MAQTLYSNGTQVQTVPGACATQLWCSWPALTIAHTAFPVAQYANYSSGNPVYGSVVQFYYTFTDQGLNAFTRCASPSLPGPLAITC